MKQDNEDAAKELILSAHKLSEGGGIFGYSLSSRIAGDMKTLLDGSEFRWSDAASAAAH